MKYKKTGTGLLAIKERLAVLSARQRSLLIMVDGQKEFPDLVRIVSGLGGTVEDVNALVSLGLIEGVGAGAGAGAGLGAGVALQPVQPPIDLPAAAVLGPVSTPAAASTVVSDTPLSERELFQRAYPIATKLTSALGLRGFRLNLAVEGAGDYKALLEVAARIREAVGEEKFRPLGQALSNF